MWVVNPDGTGNQPTYGQDGQQWGAPQGGYGQPGYPQPGPPQYPAGDPWAQSSGSMPPPYPPQGYPQQGYAQSAYPPPPQHWAPPEIQVGTISLRPLDLGGIYSGAVAAIRRNPGVMVGLTAVFVIVVQLLSFLAQIPLTRVPVDTDTESGDYLQDMALASGLSFGVSLLVGIATLLLSGVLTYTVARSVMGERTRAGEAMAALAPRLLPLIGLSLLQALIILVPMALLVGLIVVIVVAAGDGGVVVGLLVGALLMLLLMLAYLALLPGFSLAYSAVILEKLGPIAGLKRGFALQRPGFWRVLGILLLTYVITGVVAVIVGIPFGIVAAVVDDGAENLAGATVAGLAWITLGTAIGQFLTAPFQAGVQALLYMDQRMRNEQFHQVLRDEAVRRIQTGVPGIPTDALWEHRQQPAPQSWY